MALLALCVATVVNCTLIFIILLTCPKMAAVLLFGESNTPALIVLGVYIAGSIAFRMSNTIARMRSEVRDYNLQQILQNLISKFLFCNCSAGFNEFLSVDRGYGARHYCCFDIFF